MVKLDRIRGSDGTGEAVRAVVDAVRLTGSSTLVVDSVIGWQGDFIGTYGSIGAGNQITPQSKRVFFGHVSGGNIEIDSFAPGYTDDGNSEGDVVLIKPTTAWANELADFLAIGHKDDGAFAQSNRTDPGFKVVIDEAQPSVDPDGNIILWFEPL